MIGHDDNRSEFTDRPGRTHDDAQYHVPPGQRESDAHKSCERSRTQSAGGVFQSDRDAVKPAFTVFT